jgi:histidine triad (HIT) family protein
VDSCIFCRIARGEVRAHVIHEDELVMAFLDNGPIRPGHTQIISREHVAYFEDLPAETAARILSLGQKLAKAMKQAYAAPRVAFLFTGGDVAHVHAHVVPTLEKGDITSLRYYAGETFRVSPIPAPADDEQNATAAKLKAMLAL